MKHKTFKAWWGTDEVPCTGHEFVSPMGIETYIYVGEDGSVLGGEVIDGEWITLDAIEATETYEHLLGR